MRKRLPPALFVSVFLGCVGAEGTVRYGGGRLDSEFSCFNIIEIHNGNAVAFQHKTVACWKEGFWDRRVVRILGGQIEFTWKANVFGVDFWVFQTRCVSKAKFHRQRQDLERRFDTCDSRQR